MFQTFTRLCLTFKPATASAHSLAFRAHSVAATYRTVPWKAEGFCIVITRICYHPDDLGDDVTCALKHNLITNTNIFPDDFIFIMQGCV